MDKKTLIKLYSYQKLSAQKISEFLNCTYSKVRYYLEKYNIPRRNQKGENNSMYGSHRVGKLNPLWKKKHTQETKEKIRQYCLDTGRWQGKSNPNANGLSDEHKAKVSKAKLAIGSTNLYCNKEFLYQKYIIEENSIPDIAKLIGVGYATIFYWLQKFNIKIRHRDEPTQKTRDKIGDAAFGENNGNWAGGISKEPYASEWTQRLRNKIRKRDDYKCQNCGMTEEEHLIVLGKNLSVHHIDYDKKNCEETNLITTCQQCNIRANKNRTYWQDFYSDKIIKIYT